ncbi:CapA family protein [Paenibacillus arenilitoris]|uniref:CapA family protein n=1 Tax=Paenibacillus arenilitoris TaxID=2772299 RepID=A0A927CJF6_9BACL|nr:CapA family protein [Paenibacillus arenilitoris]MBD2868212.1 CapA family protein [Paenibacillus arenilitoris]
MTTEFKLAAVGDILMMGSLIASAKRPNEAEYDFEPVFQHVAPLLKQADLVIGNLETPLAGPEADYTRRNPRTGFFTLNCPDELAPALKKTGFHVLTTANNHAMDRGASGLTRTLKVLDDNGLKHVGTYASDPGSGNQLIVDVKGVKVGIVSYSKGTNKIPLPAGSPWMVDEVTPATYKKTADHVRRLAREVDVVVACLHIGRECKHTPLKQSRRLVNLLLASGAHIILGNHPHVIQPAFVTKEGRFAIYSLGNFISTRLYRNPATNCGVIVQLTVRKEADGKVKVTEAGYVQTWSTRLKTAGGIKYRILPIRQTLAKPQPGQSAADRLLMRRIWNRTRPLLAAKSRSRL